MTKSKIAIGAALAGAFVLGALAIAYTSAQEQNDQLNETIAPHKKVSTSFSAQEEEDIGEIVRAYLMEHPEVIIDAVNEYSKRQRQAAETQARDAATAHLSALLDPAHGFIAGKNPDKAKVALIEMYDYHCAYCKRATSFVKDVVKDDAGVKVVFRELPILREESNYAAEMSLASRDQDKFLDLHFAMMGASGVLTKDRVNDIAKKEGLDVAKMEKEVKGKGIPAAIDENMKIAREMGVDGTPAFIVAAVDGSYVDVVNGYDPDILQEKIKEAKKAAR